jgi:hypothetical protein
MIRVQQFAESERETAKDHEQLARLRHGTDLEKSADHGCTAIEDGNAQ